MPAKTRYKVKAAQIVVKIPGAQGGEAYLRRGRRLPGNVEPEEIKRLLTLGLIDKDTDPVDDSDDESNGDGQASA